MSVRANAIRETKKYAQRMQQKKKLANIMIPQEIERRNWKARSPTQIGGSISPVKNTPRIAEKKLKHKEKRSYVNQQLSNDIKRTQDRLSRLLQPARSRRPLFSPLAKGFSIESGLTKENSSRMSSISKRQKPPVHPKGVASIQYIPPRSISLTPPSHSYNNSDTSFTGFHHQKKSPLFGASPSISPVTNLPHHNYIQPTYASRQKQVTPPLTHSLRPNKPNPTFYSQKNQNLRREIQEKKDSRCFEINTNPICEGVDEGDELVEEEAFRGKALPAHRAEWELPPPVEPFLSEQFSQDELNFYPSVEDPSSAGNKLVKIKQLFSKFKKENDRISSDYSRCSGSASLRDSLAFTYISKAPSQTSLQNTRRIINEATQKSLFQKESLSKPVSPEKATIAGMVRKKKAMSVVTGPSPSQPFGVTGVLSIPKFLSISLQQNAAALSFESEREAKGPELQNAVMNQNLFQAPTFSHKATNTSMNQQTEEIKEEKAQDVVQDYVEKKKSSARILGGAVNSALGKRLLRAFDSLRFFDPRESRVLYSCAVGLSYLLSSSLYQRLIEKKNRVTKSFFQRWKMQQEQATTRHDDDDLSPPKLQLRSNLFGFVEETQLDEQSPVFRGEPAGFGSFRD